MADQNHAENNKAVANLLLKKGLATKEQIQKAIAHQKNSDKNPSLLRVLVGMKILDKETAQKIQASMNKPKSQATEKPAETAQPSAGGFSFVDDDAEVLAREKKAGNLGVQMFDGNADITGIDLAEDDSDKIMKKKADYFEPVEAAAKKQNQKGQAQAKKKKKPIDPDQLKCQNCGAKVKENQRRCRECGMPLDLDELRSRPQDLSKKNWKMYAIPAVVLILVIIGIVFFMGEKEKSDNENKKLTAKEKAAQQKDKMEKRAAVIRTRVGELKSIKDIKEREEQALHFEKAIKEFCEENNYPQSRFAAQFKIIDSIKEQAEEERERVRKELEALRADDDDDDEIIDDDDDEEVDDDDNKPRELNERELKKIENFNAALIALFDSYDPKAEKPSSEFKKAAKDLDKNAFIIPLQKLIKSILDGEEPITEIPAVTKEDEIINYQSEPWGICLTLIIKNGRRIKSSGWADKAFSVFKKYITRYPSEVILNLKTIGSEYGIQLKDFLYTEFENENTYYMNKIATSKNRLVKDIINIKDEKYFDQIVDVLQPILKTNDAEQVKSVVGWLLKNRPGFAIDDIINTLNSEDEGIQKGTRYYLRRFGENEDGDPEIKKQYAEKIMKMLVDQEMPDLENAKVLIILDHAIGIELIIKLLKNPKMLEDSKYLRELRSIIETTLSDSVMEYYTKMIIDLKILTEHRRWLLESLIRQKGDEQYDAILDLIFKLLENEGDELNPLKIAEDFLKQKASEGKIDLKNYWSKYKALFDKHQRKDGYELFIAMDICDPSKSIQEAIEYITDDKADDRCRSMILDWYYESEKTTNEQVMELIEKIAKATIKPEPKTRGVIEKIKVDILFKNCDNKNFEAEGPRLNQAAIDSTYNSLLSLDSNGKTMGIAGITGNLFRVYNIRSGGKQDVDRKRFSEAWPAYRKALEKWEALKDKGDKPKPLPPPGKECNYKEQIIQISVASNRVRLLTSAGNVEYWSLDEKPLQPEDKESVKTAYCTNVVQLSDRIEELKGMTITTEMLVSSGDGNVIAIQAAGYQVLIIEIEKRRLISKFTPGVFKKMKLDSEGEYILFYGGESMKTIVYRTDRVKSNVVIDVVMEREDYAGFGAESKTVLVSKDGLLLRFDVDTGEKKSVHINSSLKIDDKYFTFIMGKGKYLGEYRDGRIRVRKVENGKMEEATGTINDASHVFSVVVSENGKLVAFFMKDGSVLLYKLG